MAAFDPKPEGLPEATLSALARLSRRYGTRDKQLLLWLCSDRSYFGRACG